VAGQGAMDKEEQGVSKRLVEGGYCTGIKVQTENWDELERESGIKGYTVNESGVRGGSLRKEICGKAEYWQEGERAKTESQG